jgi:GNAT superfamily N-acetyltransferase
MKIKVNIASLNELNSVAKLFNEYRIFYQQESNLTLAEAFISARIENDESIIFYAIDEAGQYLGFTQLYRTFSSVSAQPSLVLNDLYVAEIARRQGVGKLLLNTAKGYALEHNVKGLALSTAIDNNKAQSLYESLGYQKDITDFHYFLTVN